MYYSEWTPTLGEELGCQREEDNASDSYASPLTMPSPFVGTTPLLHSYVYICHKYYAVCIIM